MKRPLTVLIAASCWFILESCAACDPSAPINTSVIGNYRMTHWTAPEPVDFDQDGDFSANLLEESDCFANTRLLLHANGTFTKTYNSVNIVDGNASCKSENSSGNWAQTGNEVALIYDTPEGQNTDLYNFDAAESTLVKVMENSAFPNVDDNGVAYYDTGNVHLVFGVGH